MPPVTRTLAAGPDHSPGFWLHHAALAWTALVEDHLAPLHLTHPQFMVLASIGWLSRAGQHPSQQDVANSAGMDRMLTSRLIRRLEDAGLVNREADGADARIFRIGLTTQGRVIVGQAVELVRTIDETAFGERPATAREQLRQTTQACRDQRLQIKT